MSRDNQILLTLDPKFDKYTNFQNLGNIKGQIIGEANVSTLVGAEESLHFLISLEQSTTKLPFSKIKYYQKPLFFHTKIPKVPWFMEFRKSCSNHYCPLNNCQDARVGVIFLG